MSPWQRLSPRLLLLIAYKGLLRAATCAQQRVSLAPTFLLRLHDLHASTQAYSGQHAHNKVNQLAHLSEHTV